MPITIEVHGTPGPQGSKRHVGGGVMIESSKKVKPWREAVKWAALEAMKIANFQRVDELPVMVNIVFRFPRPKTVKREWPITKRSGDLDKLLRSTFDALKDAGVMGDDAQVVETYSRKVYGEPYGATIRLTAL